MSAFTPKKSWASNRASTSAYGPDNSRRAFVRVDFDKGAKVRVAFPDGERAYDGMDVSLYGASFLAPTNDAKLFLEGQVISSVTLEIDGVQIIARGRVVYIRKGLLEGLAKIAVELTSVKTEDVWRLARFVTKRARLDEPMQQIERVTRITKRTKSKKKPRAKKKSQAKRKAR